MEGSDAARITQARLEALARAEILLGYALLGCMVLGILLRDVFPALWFGGMRPLWSLVLVPTGATLLLAGHGVRRYPRWPLLMHVPLFLWSPVLVLVWF